MNRKADNIQQAKFQRMRRTLQFGGDNFRWLGRGGVKVQIIGRKYKFKPVVTR